MCVCIFFSSHRANSLRKGMNLAILPSTMGRQ